jgi:hypothetical protein
MRQSESRIEQARERMLSWDLLCAAKLQTPCLGIGLDQVYEGFIV